MLQLLPLIFPVDTLIMNTFSKLTCWKRKKIDNLLWCTSGIQTRFHYLTENSVCILWILSSSICRFWKQLLAEVPLQGWLATHSLGTTMMTQFLKDRLLPAMQAGISQSLLACTSPSMLVGSSPLLNTLRAPDSRAQVSTSKKETSTTINSNPMKKFQAATREDICPSLPVAIMISQWATMTSRWSIPALTPGWQL